MVKEVLKKLLLLVSLCLLTSCVANEEGNQSITDQEKEPTINEIIQKSKASLSEVNNFTLSSDNTQVISRGEERRETITSYGLTYYNESPFAYHQKLETSVSNSHSSRTENTEAEQYVKEDMAFLLNNSSNIWMEVPLELTEDLLSFQNPQFEVNRYLDLMEEYKENIELERTDNYHILSLEGRGLEVREAVMQLYRISNLANEQQSVDIVNQMEIEAIDYDLYINKDTYLQDKVEISIQLNTTFEGEPVDVEINIQTDITDYNDTETIIIPDHIINDSEEYKMELGNSLTGSDD
ncbi:DUF6612 family protein [Alkalicoccobacillus plakortidis]|uniref:Uncharacterized protein n=1 Tax=Alkalicoccobacillus plakortidis TaxID=444060 RepID=A0ABT0XEY2_9BACI|nr:DUF6612 family protein [Alkalicoccobacillus plakortidis]MCM2674453.1 hypothetical protein [Alkalicoccobacillus plakortidis]